MNKEISVIHTIASLWKSSGVTDAAVYAANGAAKEGYDVTVLTWDVGESINNHIFHPQINLLKLPYKKNFFSRLLIFRRSLLHCIQPSKDNNLVVVLHDHGLWQESNIVAGWIAKKTKTPLIISPHGMLEPWAMAHQAKKKKIAWHLYQKRILNTANCIHVTANSEKKCVATLVPKVAIKIIPLGTCEVQEASSCTSQVALFLSRIHKKKGLDILINAWSRVMPENWKLYIVGPDEDGYTNDLKTMIYTKKLDQCVTILGSLYDKDKEEVYKQSSLFVLPSYSENFGLVIAEAFMAGLPVITTDKTPWLELQTKGCGWTISPTLSELITVLKEATSLDAKDRYVMGQRGRKWMLDEFTWERYGKDMAYLYKKTAGK